MAMIRTIYNTVEIHSLQKECPQNNSDDSIIKSRHIEHVTPRCKFITKELSDLASGVESDIVKQ